MTEPTKLTIKEKRCLGCNNTGVCSKIMSCTTCHSKTRNFYNPFSEFIEADKHDPGNLNKIQDLNDISDIFNSCEYCSKDKFILITKSKILLSENFLSIVFNNIDGNTTNFDKLLGRHTEI